MTYLAFSCHVAGLDVPHAPFFAGLESGSTLSLKLQILLSCIERSDVPWLLIVDDAERASEEVVHEVLEPLARFLPGNLILAITSRYAALLDLGDLEQRGVVFPIRPDAQFASTQMAALIGLNLHMRHTQGESGSAYQAPCTAYLL